MNAAIVSNPIGDMLGGTSVANDEVEEPRLDPGTPVSKPSTSMGSLPVPARLKREGSGKGSPPFAVRSGNAKRHSVAPAITSDEMDFARLVELRLPPAVDKSWRETFLATKQLNQVRAVRERL